MPSCQKLEGYQYTGNDGPISDLVLKQDICNGEVHFEANICAKKGAKVNFNAKIFFVGKI